MNPKAKRVSVFVSYSDEAGIADPSGEFLVAGYVAPEGEWPFVASAWQERVLDGPPKIPYLHMTEIRSEHWRKRYGLSLDDSEQRIGEAVNIMHSTGYITAVMSLIKRSDLLGAVQDRFRRGKRVPLGLNEPDYFCYPAYFEVMAQQVHIRYPEAEKINFVVSKKEKVTHHLEEFHGIVKQRIAPEMAGLIGDFMPASMELQLPLQCADLLCWYFQRHYAKNMDRTDEGRFAMLVNETNGIIVEWERPALEDLADKIALELTYANSQKDASLL